MAYSLQDFCRDTRDILKTGDASRPVIEKIRVRMEQIIADPAFVTEYFGAGQVPGIKKIYTDPQLGFEVMTYRYEQAQRSQPHDHGASWAVYGQVRAHTDMTEWERTDDGSSRDRAQLKVKREYRLNPGQAGVYFVRELHSTATAEGSCYLRITGTDLEMIERLRIDPATGKVDRIHSRQLTG